jgi:hypothetical protein
MRMCVSWTPVHRRSHVYNSEFLVLISVLFPFVRMIRACVCNIEFLASVFMSFLLLCGRACGSSRPRGSVYGVVFFVLIFMSSLSFERRRRMHV